MADKVSVPVIELDADVTENVAYFDHAIAHPVVGTGLVEIMFVQKASGKTSPSILIPKDVVQYLEKQIHRSIKKLNGEDPV